MTQPPPIPSAANANQLATFLDLIKFAHSIFALPFALVATAWTIRNSPERPLAQWTGLVALVLLCMVSARTFAMSVNRLLDRRFDARNPRTAQRPSVTGAVSPRYLFWAIGLSSLGFLLGALGFFLFFQNIWPLILAVPVLFWLGGYSLTKRFTWGCHLWLGVSLGLAPLCAWIALHQIPATGAFVITFPPAPILLLSLAVVFWVAGFDILYALQDETIDRAEGLHSIPQQLGRTKALWISRLCHTLAATALFAVGCSLTHAGVYYWAGTGIATLLLIIEQSLVTPQDISRINIAFMTVNGIVGIVYAFMAIVDFFM